MNHEPLQDLVNLTKINNDLLIDKRNKYDELAKKLKELHQDHGKLSAQLNRIHLENIYDNKIIDCEKTLAKQKIQISQQLRPLSVSQFETTAQKNSIELIEILKHILKERETLMQNCAKMIEVLDIQSQHSIKNSSNIWKSMGSTREFLAPILEKMTQNLDGNDKIRATNENLDKRRHLNKSLEKYVLELRNKINLHEQAKNSALTGALDLGNQTFHRNPHISRNNSNIVTGLTVNTNLNSNIKYRTDVPHSSNSSASDHSSGHQNNSPMNRNANTLPTQKYSDRYYTASQYKSSTLKNSKTQDVPKSLNIAPNLDLGESINESIQNSYLHELMNKHYPTPLKKRSSISESLEGSRYKHINTRAGYLYNKTYNAPDTLHPKVQSQGSVKSKSLTPNSGQIFSKARQNFREKYMQKDPPPYVKNQNYSKKPDNSLSPLVVESETDSGSANSPNIQTTKIQEKSNLTKFPPATPPRTTSKFSNLNTSSFSKSPANSPGNKSHPVDVALSKNTEPIQNKFKNLSTSPRNDYGDASYTIDDKSEKLNNDSYEAAVKLKTAVKIKPKSILVPPEKSKNFDTSVKKGPRLVFDPFALLLDASLENEFDLVKQVIKKVDNPSKANAEGITALHNAVCAGWTKIVEFLVHSGVDINVADSDGWTPLHCAASCNNTPMVKFLVERGACLFAQTIAERGTAADKCEQLDDGYAECYSYLTGQQEKMGKANKGQVYALYDYDACGESNIKRTDELTFKEGDLLIIQRKNELLDSNEYDESKEVESEWWWAKNSNDQYGYVPRNFLGVWPRIHAPNEKSISPRHDDRLEL